MKVKTEALHVRLSEETMKQLDELCKTWGLRKTQCIERLIYGEYLKSTEIGQAKIEEVAKAFGIIQKQTEELRNAIK